MDIMFVIGTISGIVIVTNLGFYFFARRIMKVGKPAEVGKEVQFKTPYEICYFFHGPAECIRLCLLSLFYKNNLKVSMNKAHFKPDETRGYDNNENGLEAEVFSYCSQAMASLKKKTRNAAGIGLQTNYVCSSVKLNDKVKTKLGHVDEEILKNDLGFPLEVIDDFYFLRFCTLVVILSSAVVLGILFAETFKVFMFIMLVAGLGTLMPLLASSPGLTVKGKYLINDLKKKYWKAGGSIEKDLFSAAVKGQDYYHKKGLDFLRHL